MGDLSGQRLGPYELREVIGRGATATVYSAYQPSLNRLVAVKVLEDFNDQGLVARFKREAEAIAQLQHRNILPIYDFGTENRHFYFVVQYVQGGVTLNDFIGNISDPTHAITLVRHLLAALGYAHARGIVHRDVKPSNVLLAEPDWPLLADFGVAKLLQEGTPNLTGAGLAVGTPAYMAPEQALNQKVDARTDLYAVGTILYQLLTGKVPFEAETPHAVLLQHIDAPVVRPRQLNPAISPELEAVVMCALEKDPDKRYPDAQSMSEALRRRESPAASSGDFLFAGSHGPAPGTGAVPPAVPGTPDQTRLGPDTAGRQGTITASNPSPSRPSRRARSLRSIALFMAMTAVVGLLTFLVLDRVQSASAGEIILEPVAEPGEAPFTKSVAIPRSQGGAIAAPSRSLTRGATPFPTGRILQAQSGSAPGFYGGSTACDVETLISFLQTNPDKTGAWVAALNNDKTLRWSGGTTIQTDQIGVYLRELTPVVLRHDTRVTNHSFRNGQAIPRQSVLKTGTAVLIDRYGVPRVRCACGNPLVPLVRVSSEPVFKGEPWETFDPAVLVVVQPAAKMIDTFVIADPDTGQQQNHQPGVKPPPCDDVDGDGACDPPCPDENGDGYCDQPCDDTDNDGNCDQPCPDANNDQHCDGEEPPAEVEGSTLPTSEVPQKGAVKGTPECPNGDADGICDVVNIVCPEDDPDTDGDGFCDSTDPNPKCADFNNDGICDSPPPLPDCYQGDANADGICDDLETPLNGEPATSTALAP